MIRLSKPHDGLIEYIAPAAIARVIEPGASSQWHGIRAIVKTFDGKTLECAESVQDILKQMKEQTP